MKPMLQMRAVQVTRGHKTVLQGLDWDLLPGQVIGLLGRNGAGKSTLLETALGLLEPSTGSVQLLGEPAGGLSDAARARIGYVPQHSDLFESFTPRQLLAYFKSFYPRWNEARVQGLMARWELPQDQLIGKLSGGQQQRLSIVRALAHEPDLLVLDEPVASLDPAGRRDFLHELVDQVLERNTTVLFSTHILSDLERVAFNVAFLKHGRIAVQAPLDQLLEQVRSVTLDTSALNDLIQTQGAEVLSRTAVVAGQERALLRFAEVPEQVSGLVALNLEDLFLELT